MNSVLALAAALNWPMPDRTRPGLRRKEHSLVTQAQEARSLLNAGKADAALKIIIKIVRAFPAWPGGWTMAGEGFLLRGEPDRAREWLARVESIRSAS